MANNLGNFDLAMTVFGKFVSVRADTAAPATLTSGALSVYKDSSTTQSTTGVTFTGDFDSVTGLNHFAIDTSADSTFYSAGSFYDIVITTGTVNSVSAVGYCVGQFTLRATSHMAVDSGVAQAGGNFTITLRSGASATDSIYNGSVVTIYGGTGVGQSRVIIGYVGSTKVATLARNWATNPDNTSIYKVHGLAVPRVDDSLAVILQTGTGTGQLDFTSGVVKANPTQLNGDATSAANLASSTRAIARGTVGSGSTTTSIVTSACTPSGAVANQFVGRTVLFDGATTTTALRGQAASITASSNAAAPVFTVSTMTTAPASGDLFSVL